MSLDYNLAKIDYAFKAMCCFVILGKLGVCNLQIYGAKFKYSLTISFKEKCAKKKQSKIYILLFQI